jgi:hypothetical protein
MRWERCVQFSKNESMNSNEFIESIKSGVEQSTLDGLKSLLEKPPAHSPSKELVGLSDWYKSLDISNKENMHEIIRLATKHSIFGMLCVIDGVRQIENTYDKGELVLEFHKNGEITRLNDPNEEFLHDIFNSE